MNKICGYSCEHNKSGVCQISVCDKRPIMSDKTEVQTFTRYIDTTITELQQENQQLKIQISAREEEYRKLEVLVERLKLGVTLNQGQEELLDKILFERGVSDENQNK